ncbi:MAG: hypothetical protein HYW48_02820 [Deltaproteobacteria bacterium]|nr:hypothetical protein [Deltaproteobacteria bacterium]
MKLGGVKNSSSWFLLTLFVFSTIFGTLSFAQEETKKEEKFDELKYLSELKKKQEEEEDDDSSTRIRRFHEVLDELLAEFGYDVKLGQLNGLTNLAIRRVEVSDALPGTYRDYVKLLISERLRENSQLKIINCLPCQSRTSKVVDGKIVITSPVTNIYQLQTAADQLGIENFLDIVLVYHSTHMVLAFQIFKTKTNEMIWARTYNSETIRSRFQKLAVDYSQVAKSRVGEEYQPEYKLLVGIGAAGIPNVGGETVDRTMIEFQFRGTERFDNRQMEFGLMMGVHVTMATILQQYPTESGTTSTTSSPSSSTTTTGETPDLQPYQFALSLYGLYVNNFLGKIESYDEVRHGLHLGVGVLLTASYLAPIFRIGWDAYFGRRFTFSLGGVYITPSRVLVGSEFLETKGGMGADAILSFNF